MARPPRSNKAETKTKINDADRSRRKADAETKAKISDADRARRKARKTKLGFLRTFLLIAFTATSLASPSTGLAMAASIGAFGETCAPRTFPRRPRSARRPSADELKKFAAELVDKRLGKLKSTWKGKALLQGNNAEDAVNAVLTLFFARLSAECARTVFEMTRSGESFETLEDLLRLSPKAAKRAVEAYTKKPLGVYYYEVPFFEPDSEIVSFYESYRSDHVKDETTEFGPSFINKCRGKWKTGGAARVRYVGKRAQKLLGVIERGVQHFDDDVDTSGTRFFSPAATRVPKLYNACDANSRDARGVIAALLLDDLDVRELAKTLGMEPEKACEFAETVMMALLRTRCGDEDGGCGTNVNDGFMTFLKKTTKLSTSTNLLINRIVDVLTSNTGGMTYKEIANKLKASYSSVHNLMKSKDHKSKFESETRTGHANVLFFRLLKTGEAPAPNLLIDRVVDVLTSNTGGMTHKEIATKLKTSYSSVCQQMTSKVHKSKFKSEKRPRHGNVLFFRLLKTGSCFSVFPLPC
uniref:Uncharacterized protein n=1 Tax=Micromonas pusilla TaxID=38833 RepID=A0A7S0CTW5_MICPS|mmetsp:Transcript_12051/g.51716  ORF Transcript_12051/g.51716 Transcript_12051/m.51716 type:complete len:526 (+) Transcript_12051:392-1969(+)